jgi:branched-chain amino acid transport system permease protein
VAHGEILMLGGYLGYWGFVLLGVSPLLLAPVAAVLGGLLGAGLYVALFRRMLRSRQLAARIEANSLLIFFGVSVVMQNGAALAFSANERGYSYLQEIIHIGDLTVTANRLATLAVAATTCAACLLFFRFARPGVAIRAVIQQPQAAALVGINVDHLNTGVFALGFALAAVAGILISMAQQISPFVGFPFTISAFVVIILGGLGHLFGSVLGAIIIAVVEVYGVALISASVRSILVYGVFIAVLLVRPQGLLNSAIRVR